jgi:hypothetical protein
MIKEFEKYMKSVVIFLIISCLTVEMKAQEMLVDLGEQHERPTSVAPLITKSILTIGLPFVDDFSRLGYSVPDPRLWNDSQTVFVNRTFAIAPPTTGVATFDPFDSKGKIYAAASNTTFAADTLTSGTIQLGYLPSDSICLSFYVQPCGYGDMPESRDSLTLEFYSPVEERWNKVWSASVVAPNVIRLSNHLSGTSTVINDDSIGFRFFSSIVKIEDGRYLVDGFAFRFINYASINVHPNFPGRSTASDHWHLDFVYLDKNRSTTNHNIPDIALTKTPKRLTTDYETIPARHVDAAKSDLFDNPMNLELHYTNLGWGTRSVTRNFRLRSLYGMSGKTLSYSAGTENINNGTTIDLSYAVPSYDFSVEGDSAAFEFLTWIVTDSDHSQLRTALRYNDTNRIVYQFKDCYAYDDGTAENGYGLFGNGSSIGKVAVKFRTYVSDSLRGVYMYFNRAVNDVNKAHKFVITVWNDSGNIPGDVIQSEIGAKPVFRDSLNRFVAYKFEKPVYLAENEPFYIGWEQTDDGFINIGFDRNRNSKHNTFYTLGQTWESSVFDGSLMMRPIFCNSDAQFPSDHVELEDYSDRDINTTSSVKAFPNPATGTLYLEDDGVPFNSRKIELYALSGELVKVFDNVLGNIDVTGISSGIYLMKIWDNNNKALAIKKIIIAGY